MIPHFFVTGSQTERPHSQKTIFADGSADATFRPGVDLELSHWLPNGTPEEFKADTSTEICMNFVAAQSTEGWDLAINNHLDCDGILCIFTLVHSQFALKHRETIVQAAQMGDFWAYGDRAAQILFQGLTLLMNRLKAEKVDIIDIYEQCFQAILSLVENVEQHAAEPAIQAGLVAVQNSMQRVKSGEIARREMHEHFAHYHIPFSLYQADATQALYVPKFNAPLADDMWLLPTIRDRFDHEKVHLISVTGDRGTYYDLWYPGYMWADTATLWQAPGFEFSGSTNGYYYGHEPLAKAVAELQARETANGTWTLARELSPFSSVKGRNFPVVLSFVDEENQPAQSALSADWVVLKLATAFSAL